MHAHLDATYRRLHTDRRERWHLMQMTVGAHGITVDDYPDYPGSEEEYDAEAIEAELERSTKVIRVERPEVTPEQE